jgi:hypothetical protein
MVVMISVLLKQQRNSVLTTKSGNKSFPFFELQKRKPHRLTGQISYWLLQTTTFLPVLQLMDWTIGLWILSR